MVNTYNTDALSQQQQQEQTQLNLFFKIESFNNQTWR